MPGYLENSAVATELEKVSFHFNSKERQYQRMFKLLYNCNHLTRLQSNAQNSPSQVLQYMNCEIPDIQDGFQKGRGIWDQIANIHWILEKAREFQKNIYFCFIEYIKAFDCLSQVTQLCLFVTPWTVDRHAPPSMGFSSQEYWSGLPFPSPGGSSQPMDWTLISRIVGRRFTIWATREVLVDCVHYNKLANS